ncbi:MAG: ROK family protein [Acidobacteriota bacterium]
MKLFGAIEAGGTKFVCGIGTGPNDLRTVRFPTTSPDHTIEAAIGFLRREGGADLASVGIGAFGPVELDPASPHYGFITSTPKAGWQYTDLAGRVQAALDVPVGFDTDVNASVFGETRWGAARDVSSAVYLTIGTGIGGGAIMNGRLLHGMMHPEMGHIRIPHDPAADPYPGGCPFHGDCLEGLASGPAMQARWGKPAYELPADHPAWALEARYLALAVANILFILSPGRIILGGGVMQEAGLFDRIRGELALILNGYIRMPQVLGQLDHYVVAPGLGDRAGILGALALAEQAYQA